MSANTTESPMDLAEWVMAKAKALGADEVRVGVSEGSGVELTRRDGRVENASEATTRGLGVALLIDDRWSSHRTSDLRKDALLPFLERAVAATKVLEPDPARRLAPASECGRGASEAELEHLDPGWASRGAAERGALVQQMESAVMALRQDDFVSATTFTADGWSRGAVVASNGFADVSESAWFGVGGALTLSDEDGRRPEGHVWYAARHLADLPSLSTIAADLDERGREAIGAGPTASGRYPMILLNRVAGRILGTLGGPISGQAIHYGRSCMADKLGQAIGSSKLTILDDPTIPRGLGSTPWDGDLRVAVPRVIVEDGVLRTHYLSTYYARKLGREPTTGGRTNWVVPPGTRSWKQIAAEHPKAILVTGFLGGNANPTTGDFSFGVRGLLLERGEPVARLAEMNVTGNVLQIFHQLAELADDPWTWSPVVSPTLCFNDVVFSGN